MNARVTLLPVAPIGTRTTLAFVNRGEGRGGLEEVTLDVYPEASVARGRAFREYRVRIGRSLREAAQLLGLHAVDVSSLERGAATLSEDEWGLALETLA